MTRKHIVAWAKALAVAVAFSACDDGTGAGAPGEMSVLLTDAEGDFLQAWVEIRRVELVGDGDGEGEGDGGTVLRDTPFTTNLLTLANDFATLVNGAVVPAGTYSQLRFLIPNACIEVEGPDQSSMVYASEGFTECGDADGPLQLPSFDQSGLKVNLPGGGVTIDGNAQILLADFDVSQSFGQVAGGSGQWVMHPVIRAEEFSVAGTVTVELTAAEDAGLDGVGGSLADFQARLSSEEVPVAFEDPDTDGVWTATFVLVLPGSYQVSVERKEGVSYDFTTNPESPQNVEMGEGGDVTVPFVLTSATPPAS
jgi:hypothetical protein